ncbi:MAG: YafY family transcriptional regulator [Clostridia bacterium]|nr:YafY family transcriptional regulator [Clostridia bacterium]
MQVNRLFEIVYILLEKGTVKAKDLADHFGVSVRTIYRDIDVLSTANIPIYTNNGKGGGISILDSFVLDKSLISEDEQKQILFALQSLEKMNLNDEQKLLDKMSTLFNKDVRSWIEIDFSSWGTDNTQNERFNKIREAIINRKLIEFTYFNSYGEENRRQVEPLQILFKDKSWFLKAYCRLKKDYRIFKISRIRDIQVLEQHYEREIIEDYKEEYDNAKSNAITLKMKISKDMTYRVYDEFEKENIRQIEDGDFIVEIDYPENEWLYGYIMSFGEYAKVLSPEQVKKNIIKKLEKNLNNYL